LLVRSRAKTPCVEDDPPDDWTIEAAFCIDILRCEMFGSEDIFLFNASVAGA
jgi:hypothetical protein